MARLSPGLVVLESEGQFDEVLDARQGAKRFRWNRDACAGTRGEVQHGQRALLDHFAVRLEPPLADGKVLQAGEVIPVLHLDSAAGEIPGLAVDVLIDVFDLVQAGMRLAIGGDQAVAAEVVVARRAGWAEVAAVGPEGLVAGLDLLEVG